MVAYLGNNPQHKHGVPPKPSFEELGVSESALLAKCTDLMLLFDANS